MMSRFFIEVGYLGTNYSGFQKQQNANSIQAEIEKALFTYFRIQFELTGSSRTDAGVHALQNFFHFDSEFSAIEFESAIYHLNAILPDDIVIYSIEKVADHSHCRFDATSRMYRYTLYNVKNPFLKDRGLYLPYPLNIEKLNGAAETVLRMKDFEVFSKKNSQVFTYHCEIRSSKWLIENEKLIYEIEGNRFLRGMVRGLTGTMLKVGRNKITLDTFESLFHSKDQSKVDFSVPARGLTLISVNFLQPQ